MTLSILDRSSSALCTEEIKLPSCYLIVIDGTPETIDISSIQKLWDEVKVSDSKEDACRHVQRLGHIISYFIRNSYCRNDPVCSAFISRVRDELHLVKKNSISALTDLKYQLFAQFESDIEIKILSTP